MFIPVVLIVGCSVVNYESSSQRESAAAGLSQAAQKNIIAIDDLLDKAERALKRDRLMLPANDNAYDRYKAVLLLNAVNQKALTGLSRISRRYCQLAVSSRSRGKVGKSKAFLNRADQVVKGHRCIAVVKQKKYPSTSSALSLLTTAEMSTGAQFGLPLSDLRVKSKRVKDYLMKIAVQAKKKGVALVIVARNDKEGRWIYSEMRKGVPGYRLRGNIRHGSSPAVVFGPLLSDL